MKKLKFIGILLVVGFIFYFVIVKPLFLDPYLLRNSPRYTVGTIIAVESSAEGGPTAEYSYKVNGKIYKGIRNIDARETLKVGERYIVKFYVYNPDNANILVDEPTLQETSAAPDDGWDSLP